MLNIKIILTLLLSLFAFTSFAVDTSVMSQQTLLTTLEKGAETVVILDVRSAEEYNHGHIKGAINISHEKITDNLALLAQYQHNTLVVYCRSGHRAAIAEDILAANGFKDLRHLTGDMNGWLAAKLPVVSSEHAH